MISPRERFNRAMRFQSVDRIPLLHPGLWRETAERWQKEGILTETQEFAGFDGPMQSCWLYGRFQGPIPSFEEKVLVESENYIERQNYLGQIERVFKDRTSMPAFLKYPVTSRKDWEEYRKRFDPDSPGRYPNDWQRLVKNRQTVESGEIRGVAVWGFYGFPREMCGPEGLSYLFYDDPELIAEMNEYWLYYSIKRLAEMSVINNC